MPVEFGSEPVKMYWMTEDGEVLGEATTFMQELEKDDAKGHFQEATTAVYDISDAFDCNGSFAFTLTGDALMKFVKAIVRSYSNNWRKMHGIPKIRRRKR